MALIVKNKGKLTKSASVNLKKFDSNRIMKESNPNYIESNDDLFFPDLIMKGQKLRCYETKGCGLEVTLDNFHEKRLFDFIRKRLFFRIAFIRIVWIPMATNLPGKVTMGIKDLRIKVENKCNSIVNNQVIDKKTSNASLMHQFSYQQDIYIHKSDLKRFSIFVKLDGHQEFYDNESILGSVRVYWLFQTTNVPTQHEQKESESAVLKVLPMPDLFQEDSYKLESNRLTVKENENENDDNSLLISDNILEMKAKESSNKNVNSSKEFIVKITPELNLKIAQKDNIETIDKIKDEITKTFENSINSSGSSSKQVFDKNISLVPSPWD